MEDLNEPIAAYIANAAEKLRSQESVCGYLQVYMMTNRFKQERYYANVAGASLVPPTAYTPQLIQCGQKLLKSIFKYGYGYKKAGVILSNLQFQRAGQNFLFDENYHNSRRNTAKVFIAPQGMGRGWYNEAYKSQRFTTRWDELLEIRI